MENIQNILTEKTIEAIQKLYGQSISPNQITLQKTKIEFEGDITLLVFPLIKASKKSPEQTAEAIGNYLKENISLVKSFNVVKGFLNLVIDDSYWTNYLLAAQTLNIELGTPDSETIMIEFSSPNTNKPLHLGHVRNNLLGSSLANILKAAGKNVIRVNLVNDRGIHICKSMLAWQKWGNGETPESSGMKGDHLVGKYYVLFSSKNNEDTGRMISWDGTSTDEYNYLDSKIKEKIIVLKEEAAKKDNQKIDDEIFDLAQNNTRLMFDAKELLRKWESGDKETIDLWKKMNGWVYDGFAVTYKNIGIEFEKTYYESETYLLGKEVVEDGLNKKVFEKNEDGSVFIDLTNEKLDKKILLRSDGTSVYMTQDLGTVMQRLQDFKEPKVTKLIYVVGSEQDYHFKVLFLIIKKLVEQNVAGFGTLSEGESGERGLASLFHLSYGMVDLPSGKMKSREGTVVDADELMDEMVNTARETTKALGKTEGMNNEEAENLYHSIGLGALKYFILKVDPKKRMLFDPKESIDFNGNTGPFIQYTYARIKSVLRKANENQPLAISHQPLAILHKKEKEVIKLIHGFSAAVQEAAETYNPGHIANYVYDLAKEYNQFYHEFQILKAEKEEEKNFRLMLSAKTAEVLKSSLNLLGINAPERM